MTFNETTNSAGIRKTNPFIQLARIRRCVIGVCNQMIDILWINSIDSLFYYNYYCWPGSGFWAWSLFWFVVRETVVLKIKCRTSNKRNESVKYEKKREISPITMMRMTTTIPAITRFIFMFFHHFLIILKGVKCRKGYHLLANAIRSSSELQGRLLQILWFTVRFWFK